MRIFRRILAGTLLGVALSAALAAPAMAGTRVTVTAESSWNSSYYWPVLSNDAFTVAQANSWY